MNAPVKMNPVAEVGAMLAEREQEFHAALPKHMPVERFMRVVMTAVQTTPALAKVERRSLFTSAMKAAQDGLLPDGREAALVIYKDKNRGEIAQYMPMIAGIRKKVRNSGEIETWDAHVVYENDQFDYELGDAPFIRHKPALGDRGRVIAAYAVATLKSGEKSREVMSIEEIEAIRRRSRAAGSGPWVTDYAEMCRKTVARRHAKVLPMSTDLDDVLRRDDELYDMAGASDKVVAEEKPRGLSARMDALAAPRAKQAVPAHDEETGEIIDHADSAPAAGRNADEPSRSSAPSEDDRPAISSKAAADDASEGNTLEAERAARAADPVAEEDNAGDFPGDQAPLQGAIGLRVSDDGQILQDNEDGLLERGLKRVAKGSKAYGLWVGGLSKEDQDAIAPINGKLLRLAALNDLPKAEGNSLEPGSEESIRRAEERGKQAAANGAAIRAVPPEYRADGFEKEARAWADGHRSHKPA